MSKKPANNASILETLAIPAQVLESIAAADAALAAGPKVAKAIADNIEAIETAKAEFERAADAQAHTEASLCLVDGPAESKRIDDEAVAAGVLAEEKRRTLERLQRVGNALKEKASTIDLEVKLAQGWLSSETGVMRDEAVCAITHEIAEASKPLLAVLAKGYALMRVLPHRDLGIALSEARIPNPLDFQAPFLEGDRLILDGAAQSLATTWRDDPVALAIYEKLKAIPEANQRLGRHVPYSTTQKATGRGWSVSSGNGITKKVELNMGAVLGGDLAQA